MSTSNLRIVAVGLTLIFAVLTGVLTGYVGSGEVCARTSAPVTDAPPAGQDPGPEEGPAQGGRTDPEQPAAPADGEQCEQSFNAGAAVIGFVGAGLAGLAVLAVASTRRRDPVRPLSAPPVQVPAPVQVPPTQHAPVVDDKTHKERATLIETCIYVRDRATSKAIADRLGWALQQVGVAELAPAGVAFDPAHHEAGGALPTEDPRQAGTVAAVEILGYTDRGAVLRAPVVTVYRSEAR